MNFRRDITVYIRTTQNHSIGWDVFPIKQALVKEINSANSNISAKGLVPNSNVTVRFPDSHAFRLAPGDKIYIGGTEDTYPPSDSLSVLSVTGGDRGSRTLRLIKAVCG